MSLICCHVVEDRGSVVVSDNRPGCPLSFAAPWQQVVDPVDLVVRDAGEGVGEPGAAFDGFEFGCFDQGVGNGGGLAARLEPDEEVVLLPDGNGAGKGSGQPGRLLSQDGPAKRFSIAPLHNHRCPHSLAIRRRPSGASS